METVPGNLGGNDQFALGEAIIGRGVIRVSTSGIIPVLCFYILAGCYHVERQPTVQDMLAATTREYPDVPPEQVYAASRTIFELADKDDVTLEMWPNGLVAQRQARVALTKYREIWEISALPHENGTRVSLVAETEANGVRQFARTPAPYEVFFARLDFLLGKTHRWMSCTEYHEEIQHHPTWGRNESWWCLLADDEAPPLPVILGQEMR